MVIMYYEVRHHGIVYKSYIRSKDSADTIRWMCKNQHGEGYIYAVYSDGSQRPV